MMLVPVKDLKTYRLVCKLWNKNVVDVLRHGEADYVVDIGQSDKERRYNGHLFSKLVENSIIFPFSKFFVGIVSEVTSIFLSEFAKHGHRIKSLEVVNSNHTKYGKSLDDIYLLLQATPNLEHLTIVICEGEFDPERLRDSSQPGPVPDLYLPKLKSIQLDINFDAWEDEGFDLGMYFGSRIPILFQAAPNLESVDVKDQSFHIHLFCPEFLEILHHTPTLKRISIQEPLNLHQLKYLFIHSTFRLKSLRTEISDDEGGDFLFTCLSRGATLETLHLTSRHAFYYTLDASTAVSPSPMRNLKSLTLDLESNNRFSFNEATYQSQFPNLKKLNLIISASYPKLQSVFTSFAFVEVFSVTYKFAGREIMDINSVLTGIPCPAANWILNSQRFAKDSGVPQVDIETHERLSLMYAEPSLRCFKSKVFLY